MSHIKETNIKLKNNYSKLSYDITRSLTKDVKKRNGIFFTPQKTINEILKRTKRYFKADCNVLEPSCGSCEFITSIRERFPEVMIDGVEKSNEIYKQIEHIKDTHVALYNEDYLTSEFDKKYDIIIGNPPYFVMKNKDVSDEYKPLFSGRPNIFIIFLLKSLLLLNDGGVLAFVLPRSFLNSIYYDKTRRHIFENYNIITIFECNDTYIETTQNTIVIILQNKTPRGKKNLKFVKHIGDMTVFGEPSSIKSINTLYENSTTLLELGFCVKVGNVVWNQCKSVLTNDETKTRLIYSPDIKGHKLRVTSFRNELKKNYINKKGESGPILVVNRGYGIGTYKFEYCLIDEDFEYLIENHLICIKPSEDISHDELIVLYHQIIESFEDPRTKKFIEIYFGNNAMSTKELERVLPIYID